MTFNPFLGFHKKKTYSMVKEAEILLSIPFSGSTGNRVVTQEQMGVAIFQSLSRVPLIEDPAGRRREVVAAFNPFLGFHIGLILLRR